MNHLIFPFLIAGAMIVNWIAVWQKLSVLNFFSKPAVILLFLISLPGQGFFTYPIFWFWIGLGFSLLGDILLMLPKRYFLSGLGAFLITHLCYFLGLNLLTPPHTSWISPLITGVVLTAAIWVHWLTKDPNKKSISSRELLAVLVYSCLLLMMTGAAVLTHFSFAWKPIPAFSVSLGAGLFLISDGLIGWHKYIKPVPFRDILVRISYHAAQAGIVIGVLMQYQSP